MAGLNLGAKVGQGELLQFKSLPIANLVKPQNRLMYFSVLLLITFDHLRIFV